MYYVRLGIHLFSSKTLSNMLLLILVALSLIMSNVAVGMFNMQFSLLDSVQNFDKENTYYYMDIGEDFEDSYDEEGNLIEPESRSIAETIKNADKDNVFDVGYIYYDTAVAYRQQRTVYSKAVTYIGVDNKTSEKLNYGRLIQGEWYTKAPKTKDYVNVVAVEGNYEVGDKFNIVLENYDKDTSTNIKCIVTGLLEQGTNMLIPDGGAIGTSMNLEGLMQGIYTEKNGDILFV